MSCSSLRRMSLQITSLPISGRWPRHARTECRLYFLESFSTLAMFVRHEPCTAISKMLYLIIFGEKKSSQFYLYPCKILSITTYLESSHFHISHQEILGIKFDLEELSRVLREIAVVASFAPLESEPVSVHLLKTVLSTI